MNSIIINADDCGMSVSVNSAIDSAIAKGLITSTTVMANMDDFDGAVNLYNKWKDKISFGVHINITEGYPLMPSKIMAESGFCISQGDNMVFNNLHYLYKYPSKALKESIYLEIKAQIEKILDSGIKISHIDSHRHMHLAPFILPIVCYISREFGITKMRQSRNRLGFSLRDLKDRGLNVYRNFIMKDIKKTDVFCSVAEFSSVMKNDNKIYELMCHPGHPNQRYIDEMNYLEKSAFEWKKFQMINYYDI